MVNSVMDSLKIAFKAVFFCPSQTLTFRKVASSSKSQLLAHFQIFRRLMKGKFDAYVL